jgi:iron complex transport system ATP-binding protein
MLFSVKNISYAYDDQQVINNLSVNFEKGKFYGIMGPNGCGKTTFLDLLTKQVKPAFGEIDYKGKNLITYSRKELSREIALVPQNFYINFSFTAKDIVMMGRYPHIPRFSAPSEKDKTIVDEIMTKTDTRKFQNRLITELSGGERQRVVFARALVQDTPVLILDEATSNFDINFTINMLNITLNSVINENKTVIAVMQDINLAAAYCQYLIFINNGCVSAHGPVDEVLNSSTIKSVFNIDAKVYDEPYSQSKQVVFKH